MNWTGFNSLRIKPSRITAHVMSSHTEDVCGALVIRSNVRITLDGKDGLITLRQQTPVLCIRMYLVQHHRERYLLERYPKPQVSLLPP